MRNSAKSLVQTHWRNSGLQFLTQVSITVRVRRVDLGDCPDVCSNLVKQFYNPIRLVTRQIKYIVSAIILYCQLSTNLFLKALTACSGPWGRVLMRSQMSRLLSQFSVTKPSSDASTSWNNQNFTIDLQQDTLVLSTQLQSWKLQLVVDKESWVNIGSTTNYCMVSHTHSTFLLQLITQWN